MFLARHARRVTMLVRAASLEESMSHYLIRQIAEIANIEVRLQHRGDRRATATSTSRS